MEFIRISRKFNRIGAQTKKERGLKNTYERKQSIRNTEKGMKAVGIKYQNVNETQKLRGNCKKTGEMTINDIKTQTQDRQTKKRKKKHMK